jgi:hypothetical protein
MIAMATKQNGQNIQTRQQLYKSFQTQMEKAYWEVRERKRLKFESNLIKSYILEIDLPENLLDSSLNKIALKEFISECFQVSRRKASLTVLEKEEFGFYELVLAYGDNNGQQQSILYLDTITNARFWFGFSLSSSQRLDWWLKTIVKNRSRVDFVWFWPAFLEHIQSRGLPRGFGLDYDYRKFEDADDEATTYLKMQLWGGDDTQDIYNFLKSHPDFKQKTVLSKVRMKVFGDSEDRESFALQDVKYEGKFTTRGTDFSTHAATLSYVRGEYEKHIQSIEDTYALQWRETERGGIALEGFAIHFIPDSFELPVDLFCDHVFNGTEPFRLLGFVSQANDSLAIIDAVDLHTGGTLAFEIYPDLISIYLPENTCGNTLARFYTNLQHHFNALFVVEADNGDKLFLPSTP